MDADNQTILCFDFGMSKIGVAIGQAITRTARPLQNIKAQDGIPSWEQIQQLIDEWAADALVVGLPYNMDGSLQDITFAARKFSRRLEAKFRLPVFLSDERLTTKEALSLLKDKGNKKTDLDSMAAVLILESWFREHSHD
jgi:putative Holliday junction resolvase